MNNTSFLLALFPYQLLCKPLKTKQKQQHSLLRSNFGGDPQPLHGIPGRTFSQGEEPMNFCRGSWFVPYTSGALQLAGVHQSYHLRNKPSTSFSVSFKCRPFMALGTDDCM